MKQLRKGLVGKKAIILFVVPPKFCISIFYNFSWQCQSPQEKLKTMLGGTTKTMMLVLKKAYKPVN